MWTKNHTLIRKPSITSGVTQNPQVFDPTLEWDTLTVNSFQNLGGHQFNGCGVQCVNTSNTVLASICTGQSYNFFGQILTTSGTYSNTIPNAAGCDSVITLTLNVQQIIRSTINESFCSGTSYNFNGNMISAGGLYTDTLTSTGGCDSIVTLTLTENQTTTPSVSISSNTTAICSSQSVQFLSNSLNAGSNPSYNWKSEWTKYWPYVNQLLSCTW